MKFLELKAHIRQNRFFPCYALHGDDSFLIKNAINQFSSAVGQFKDLNIAEFDGGADINQILSAAEALPFMGAFRLIIARARLVSEFIKYLKNPPPTTVLLLLDVKDDLKQAKNVEPLDCNRLPQNILVSYITTQAQKHGLTVDVGAAMLLTEYCSRFMGRIETELTKLTSYVGSGEISAADVQKMVAPALDYKVYELADSVAKRDADRAMSILNDMLEENNSAPKIFGLVYAHFRRLLFAALSPDDPNLAAVLNVKDYALKMALAQSKQFSKIRLKEIADSLHKTDHLIKSSSADKIALESFVLSVLGGQS